MADFESWWTSLRADIRPPEIVRNWTGDSGYLDDNFIVSKVTASVVMILDPAVSVPKDDFRLVFNIWPEYIAHDYPRSKIRDSIRTSKYVISLLHAHPPA